MNKKLLFSWVSWPIFLVFFGVHFVLALGLMGLFPKPYLAHIQISRFFIRILLRIHGVRIIVTGIEHVPVAGPVIIMANHLSLLDIFTLMVVLPIDFAFVGKEELARVPLLGWDMRLQRHFFIKRSGGKGLIKQMEAIQERIQKTGRSIMVFPEGTRSKTGELGVFKSGFFKMAASLSLPILPCTIYGTNHILSKHSFTINRGNISVMIHPMVMPNSNDGDVTQLQDQVRLAIASARLS